MQWSPMPKRRHDTIILKKVMDNEKTLPITDNMIVSYGYGSTTEPYPGIASALPLPSSGCMKISAALGRRARY